MYKKRNVRGRGSNQCHLSIIYEVLVRRSNQLSYCHPPPPIYIQNQSIFTKIFFLTQRLYIGLTVLLLDPHEFIVRIKRSEKNCLLRAIFQNSLHSNQKLKFNLHIEKLNCHISRVTFARPSVNSFLV